VSKVVLKDKKDMNHLSRFEFWHDWEEVGLDGLTWEDFQIVGSQDEIERDLEVEVLSVKFSKVGQKTFNAYPNLKWIICRAHGYDNINLDLARSRGVGIVCTSPDEENVAEWILRRKALGTKPLILGSGRIGHTVSRLYDGIAYDEYPSNRKPAIGITSSSIYPYDYTKNFDTIIVTSSPTKYPILTKKFLKHFRGNIISISRPSCIDNEALLEAINDDRVEHADMDMLDPDGRQELIDTGKVSYTAHTAWQALGIHEYEETYFIELFEHIHYCISGKNDSLGVGVVLERKSNSLFGD